MAKQKYLVRLVRPVFQTAYLEVEGSDEREAALTAFTSAYEIPDDQWTGRFDPEDYIFDVNCVRTSETPEGHPFSLLDFPLYCIFSTNESSHLSNASTQPWMNELEPLTVANLYSQWITQLRNERVGYYEEAIDTYEERLKSFKGTDQKVVPLMPPAERRFDIDVLEALLSGIRLMKEVD